MSFWRRAILAALCHVLAIVPFAYLAISTKVVWWWVAALIVHLIVGGFANWFVYGGFRDRQRTRETMRAVADVRPRR